MLLLTSNGLSNESLLEKVKIILPKSAKKAVIVTTASEGKDRDISIRDIIEEMKYFNLTVDFYDFITDDSKVLLEYDVIYFDEGNPYKLLKSIYDSGSETVILQLKLSRFVISRGTSGMIFGSNLAFFDEFMPEMNNNYFDIPDIGLAIERKTILPHYNKYKTIFSDFEKRLQKIEDIYRTSYYRINDGEVFDFGNVITIPSIKILFKILYIQLGIFFSIALILIALSFWDLPPDDWTLWPIIFIPFITYMITAIYAYVVRMKYSSKLAIKVEKEIDNLNWRYKD